MDKSLNVLRIDASARQADSTTRTLADAVIQKLRQSVGSLRQTRRDLAESLPHVDESWVQANFTEPGQRDREQQRKLALSDELVTELKDADLIVIGVPVYNFGIPAALKAWIDMVARARVTFRYTDEGPKGLLQGKKAILAVASGGTEIGSSIDFATPYMRHVLGFLGISDVSVVAAGQQMVRGEESLSGAKAQIESLIADFNAGNAAAA
ncbi:MAG: NAD(P)H-dependent oxidoreductase [Gammaproteobacteria bacterium]|nr:NAD(P)H-dependent oxidoreductase [Gammaproteobacteria bacterium]